MAYSIGQYRKNNSANYMTQITTPCSSIKAGLVGGYSDECFVFPNKFKKGTNYFLHCWVKKENYNQKIKVKLCQSRESLITSSLEDMQFIKYLEYKGTTTGGWRELILLINPVVDGYDTVVFELQDREINQKVTIIYDEFSTCNNILNATAIKLGIRSNQGAIFCVNNEEIHLGKSGIFEIYDNDIQSTFCSPIAALTLNNAGQIALENAKNDGVSAVINPIGNNGRNIPFFIIDYIYEV